MNNGINYLSFKLILQFEIKKSFISGFIANHYILK